MELEQGHGLSGGNGTDVLHGGCQQARLSPGMEQNVFVLGRHVLVLELAETGLVVRIGEVLFEAVEEIGGKERGVEGEPGLWPGISTSREGMGCAWA